MKVVFKRLGIIILVVLDLVFFAFIWRGSSIYYYPDLIAPKKADAAIVLGASIWNDKPSPVYQERLNHAVTLYKAGHTDHLILTGGAPKGLVHSESMVGKDYVMSQGIPAERILIETNSFNTWGNLVEAKRAGDATGLKTYLLVTDPIHTRRSLQMGRDLGLTLWPNPTPTTKYKSIKSKLSFSVRETWYYFGHQYRHMMHQLPAYQPSAIPQTPPEEVAPEPLVPAEETNAQEVIPEPVENEPVVVVPQEEVEPVVASPAVE
ncbi:MAG: YdcF family protein [Verrucomicrobiota bacterium]|nr:YdcF family protein [Verrucomicrobiota bacterium]